MKLFSKCAACRKRKLITKVRRNKIPQVKDPISSKNHLCGKCDKEIIKLLQ